MLLVNKIAPIKDLKREIRSHKHFINLMIIMPVTK